VKRRFAGSTATTIDYRVSRHILSAPSLPVCDHPPPRCVHSLGVSHGVRCCAVLVLAGTACVAAASCSGSSPANKNPLTARLAARCGKASTHFDYTGPVPTFGTVGMSEWWSFDGNYKITLSRSMLEPGPLYDVSCNGRSAGTISLPHGFGGHG
jgi:hypothetical protein